MHRSFFLFYLLLVSATSSGQAYSLHYVNTGTNASFRGLSVADDDAVWVSGSGGWVGRTVNGGADWTFRQVPGYEKCDFRTVYGFDSSNAIIANAGSPAYILRTSDGGTSWTRVYENTDSAAFIDGIDFWNKKHGLIHGDPINGHMLLLYTKDGGKTWKLRREKSRPELTVGEACFAASGTAVRCMTGGRTIIATGGKVSRIFYSANRGKRWTPISTPMLQGSASTGIFSIMPGSSMWHWLIAGGDYRNDTIRTANFFYTQNKGKKWQAPASTTRGYRECLAQIDDIRPVNKKSPRRTSFAVGPSGIDISADDGVTWKPLSDEKGFHVMKPSRNHLQIFLAGSNGKLAIMQTPPTY